MKTVIIIVALLIILYLVSQMRTKSSCPKGYVQSPVNSTWAGWTFDCLPEGIDSTLVGIPANTRVPPLATIYAPIVSNTGRVDMGTPARLDEFGGRPTVYSRD